MFLNYVIEYFSQDKGTILMGPPVEIDGKYYIPIEIENFTYKTIDNIRFSVHTSLQPNSIKTSYPLLIKRESDMIGSSFKALITISGLPSRRVTHIFFPADGVNEYFFDIENLSELRLNARTYKDVRNPTYETFKRAFIP
jgi:hypothetical protein